MSRASIAVLAPALSLLGGSACAQPISRSIDAAPAGRVVIELADGDVTVRGTDGTTAEVSGELGGRAEDLELTRQGNEIRIRVVERADAAAGNETELYVSVPRASALTVNATNADLLVADMHGTLSLHTVSGDIDTELYGASIEAETVGGDIRVAGRGGPAEASLTTVAGEIEAGGAFSRLTASTVSGDIELDVLDAVLMSLNTTNGDIEVHATLDGAAELTAETINGDVELRVGEEGELNLDAGTFSGRIETCFDDESAAAGETRDGRRDGRRDRRDGRGRGGELVVTAAPDSPRVRVRTLNGDIEICSS